MSASAEPRYRQPTVRTEPSGLPAAVVPVAACDGGQPVAVHLLGGEGPPLLLVHATGFHGRVWGPVADALAGSFRCLAPDLRGQGDTALSADDDLDWRGFAADLLAVVDALELDRPFGVGHSSGATALLLAEQARPGTFRALYCFEPVLVPADPPLGPDPESWLAERARARRSTFTSSAEALAHYAAKRALSGLDPAVLRLFVEHGLVEVDDGVRLKCRPDVEARMYEMATAHDAYGQLGRVGCPVTLARGELSEAAGERVFAHLAGRLPRGRVEALPDVRHLGPLEQPAGVAASIRRAFTDAD